MTAEILWSAVDAQAATNGKGRTSGAQQGLDRYTIGCGRGPICRAVRPQP